MAKTTKTTTSTPDVPIAGDLDEYKDNEVAAAGAESDDPEGDLTDLETGRWQKNVSTATEANQDPQHPAQKYVDGSLPTTIQTPFVKGSETHERSAETTDWGKVTGIPYLTDEFLDGRSALSGYLRSNKRPVAPDYDDRREKALRWQRGIALLGQLGGLVGDMRYGGGRSGGGVTYQRDMGKQTDDYLRSSIDAIRQSYADQVARYTEADKLWRKGLYDAWVHDEDTAAKYGQSMMPLAKGQYRGKDGLVYDKQGHYVGGRSGGSDPRKSYVGVNIGHLRFDFKNKATADNFINSQYDNAMHDIGFMTERLENYRRVHPSKDLDAALAGVKEAAKTGNLNDMMLALQEVTALNHDLKKYMFDKNAVVNSYLTSAGVGEDVLRDAARLSENWTEEMIDETLLGRRDRLNMTNAIRQKHSALWDELQRSGGANELSPDETLRLYRQQALPNDKRFRGGTSYIDDRTLLSLNDEELAEYYEAVTGKPYTQADFYNYADFGAPQRTADNGYTGGQDGDNQFVNNKKINELRNAVRSGDDKAVEKIASDIVREYMKLGFSEEKAQEIAQGFIDHYDAENNPE